MTVLNNLDSPRNTVGRDGEVTKYKILKNIQISQLQNGGWQNISNADFYELITLASGNYGLASNQASLILKNHLDKTIVTSAYVDNYLPIYFNTLRSPQRDFEMSINVTNNIINVLNLEPGKEALLTLYNTSGAKVISKNITLDMDVKLNNILLTGIYFYQVLNSDKIITSGKIFINNQ